MNQFLNALDKAVATATQAPKPSGNKIIRNPGLPPAAVKAIFAATRYTSDEKRQLAELDRQYRETEAEFTTCTNTPDKWRALREKAIRGEIPCSAVPSLRQMKEDDEATLDIIKARLRHITAETWSIIAPIYRRAAKDAVPKLLAESKRRDAEREAYGEPVPSRETQIFEAAAENLEMWANKPPIMSPPSKLAGFPANPTK